MAWTTPRTWSAGEFVTDSMMNAHVRDNFNTVDHVLAVKTVDETVTSSTVLQNDDHLFFSIGSSETWFVRAGLWMVDPSAAADVKFAFVLPASGTILMSSIIVDSSSSLNLRHITTSGGTMSFDGIAAGYFGTFEGMVATGGTAGTVQMQWAQNTSNGTGTTLKKGSFLMGAKMV
jgi:hypothetical protein